MLLTHLKKDLLGTSSTSGNILNSKTIEDPTVETRIDCDKMENATKKNEESTKMEFIVSENGGTYSPNKQNVLQNYPQSPENTSEGLLKENGDSAQSQLNVMMEFQSHEETLITSNAQIEFPKPNVHAPERKKRNKSKLDMKLWKVDRLGRISILRRMKSRELFLQRKSKRVSVSGTKFKSCRNADAMMLRKKKIMKLRLDDTYTFEAARLKHKYHNSKSSIRLACYDIKKNKKRNSASNWKKERNIEG